MSKPIVAIVGRPNVGKSTFFNRISGNKIAIIENTPGVTRDRIFADGEWLGYYFTMIDTGGIDFNDDDIIPEQMRYQAKLAIDMADVIIFMTDATQGVLPEDYSIAEILRKTNKCVITVVNKTDNSKLEESLYDFYSLGLGEVFSVSSSLGLGIGDVLDSLISNFEKTDEDETEESVSIAFIGKPNVGKSSLTNRIIGEERSIVSNIPGTTRDSIDSDIIINDKKFTLIDTAGLRRKSKISLKTIERYSVIRTLAAIKRSDVCVLMIDASEGVSEQDAKIAGLIENEGKPCVVCVNKWDLIEKDTNTVNTFKKDINATLSFMSYINVLFISAKTGQRISKIFDYCNAAFENSKKRIQTGILNDILSDAITAVAPPSDKGRRLKIFYVTQVAVAPPTFVFFVNDPQLMHFSYLRYLENYIRKSIDYTGTPIRLLVRSRQEERN